MRKILFLIAVLFSTAQLVRAEHEETLVYGWTEDANENQTTLKVVSAGNARGKVVIPEKHQGQPVVEIGYAAFAGNTNVTALALPSTITAIGEEAFKNCAHLQSVDFGESLVTIQKEAFSGAVKPEAVSLPNTTKTIGEKAFWNCTGLKTVSLGNSLTSIGDYAFQYCKGMANISLPNSLTSVGDHFLCACKGLTTLVVPENLTTIGTYFLHGCENMKKVHLMGSKPRTLGKYPFCSQKEQNMGQVSHCTFYVATESVYRQHYQHADNWKYADAANTDYISDDGHYQNGGNRYEWGVLPDDIRPFTAQWVTAYYPTDIDVAKTFGDNALLARLSSARYKHQDAHGEHWHELDFKIVEEKTMKAHTPYLLKANPKNVGSAHIVQHGDDEAKQDGQLAVTVDIDNQQEDPSSDITQVRMLGTYGMAGHDLAPGEFIFVNNDGKLRFYKQLASGKKRHAGTYRCYWQIVKDSRVATNARMGWSDMTGDETTGIHAEVRVQGERETEVFNLQGQRVRRQGNGTAGLPSGIYLTGGKKVIVQ